MDEHAKIPELESILEAERQMALAELGDAWRLSLEAAQEQLDAHWRQESGRAVRQRFDALGARLTAEVERQVAARLEQEAERARVASARATSERLNQIARRLEQALEFKAWVSATLDGAQAFSTRVVLFQIAGGEARYEGSRGPDWVDDSSLHGLKLRVFEVPAFTDVMDTQDAVISTGDEASLSAKLSSALGCSDQQRISLVPVITGRDRAHRKVAAILLAANAETPVDVNVLEVVATLAGSALEARRSAEHGPAPAGALMAIAPAALAETPVETPSEWASLSREDQELHAKAQRFARVRVAEMRLYQSQAVRQGRENNCLYMALRGEMDRGRAQFKHEFMATASMIDYFHLEIVHTLANDDPSLLGPEYPGPLV